MKQELESILQLLLPLAPDPSNSERLDVADHQEDLWVMLQQLKGVAQTFAQTAGTQVSGSLKQRRPTLNSGIKYLHLCQNERVCIEIWNHEM